MRRLFRHLAAASLAVAFPVLAGCGGDSSTVETVSSVPASKVYTVRGVVRQLPREAGVPLLIQHESIPDFVDIGGRAAPMAVMTMPFDLADDSLLAGIAIDDKISFSLQVDWQATPAISIVAVERLPAETILEFEETS